MKRLIFLLLYFIYTVHLFAQNENTKWYFGQNAALDFMTNPPTVLNNSAMNTLEGCSSIADAGGNLLFYTNGMTIWNSQHAIMANGAGLLGGGSSTQAAFIIKKPGSSNLYYVFTTPEAGNWGFRYSIVDMSLAAGTGSVTVKNSLIYSGGCAEKLTATVHANGIDCWVIIHEYGSSNFRAYLLSSSGLNPTAVVSSVGLVYASSSVAGSNLPSSCGAFAGQMKFSPTGNKLGVAINAYNCSVPVGIQLFDFNSGTGTLSNPLTLGTSDSYGCEFSPDGTKFYSISNASLLQWDLNAGSNAAILSSSVLINSGTMNTTGFQLAPNGKIYASQGSGSFLSVINNPNAYGLACNYVSGAQPVSAVINPTLLSSPSFSWSLGISRTTFGLPAMLVTPSFTMISPSSATCAISYGVQSTSNTACLGSTPTGSAGVINLAGNNGVANYFWTNGTATYTASQINNIPGGWWVVTVTDNMNCSIANSIYIPQIPNFSAPYISMNSNFPLNFGLYDLTMCAGDTASLYANSNANTTYTWSNGANTSSIAVSPTVTTQYSLSITNQYGCVVNSTVVSVIVTSSVTPPMVTASNSTLCGSTSATLTATGGANNYHWYYLNNNTNTWGSVNNTNTPSITVSPTVTSVYYVKSYAQNGCQANSSTISINVEPVPDINVTGTFTLCSPKPQTLTVSGASSYYVWHWGTETWTITTLSINPKITTQYTVTGVNESGCSSSKVVTISIINCTGVEELTNKDNDFKIFPSPVNEFLNISFILNIPIEGRSMSASIYDVLGKEIYSQKLEYKNEMIQLDLSDLQNGIYYLKIGNKTQRFVKE